jgi:hypothetical protein
MKLTKVNHIEPTLIEFFYLCTEEGQKEMLKYIKQDEEIYIIINNIIYKCIKYNEIHHIIEDIKTKKRRFVAWSVYMNLQKLTLNEAQEKQAENAGTIHNQNYKNLFVNGFIPYNKQLLKGF